MTARGRMVCDARVKYNVAMTEDSVSYCAGYQIKITLTLTATQDDGEGWAGSYILIHPIKGDSTPLYSKNACRTRSEALELVKADAHATIKAASEGQYTSLWD